MINNEAVRKIYSFRFVRWSIKFSISLFFVKTFGDLVCYLNSDRKITIPRNNQIVGVQHPLNPPLFAPYPYENSVSNRLQNQKYRSVWGNTGKILRQNKYQIEKIYTNTPMRQNPNQIDQFLVYTEAARLIEPIYYRVLQKMQQAGTEIPDGINQKLRELEQYRLEPIKTIIPQL